MSHNLSANDEADQPDHRRLEPTANTALSVEHTMQDSFCADDSEIHASLQDPELFVEAAQRHRMKPGLARALDKEYRRTLGSAVELFYGIRNEPNRDQILQALKKASTETSRITDAIGIILIFLIIYGGTEGRQYLSRDRKITAFMIELNKQPGEVPNFIKKCGGFKACAKMYRSLKNSKHSVDDTPPTHSLPNSLSALIPDVLNTIGDCALTLNHLARWRGPKIDIVKTAKVPHLSGDELTEFWDQIEEVIARFQPPDRKGGVMSDDE